jgi:hypothetical protein
LALRLRGIAGAIAVPAFVDRVVSDSRDASESVAAEGSREQPGVNAESISVVQANAALRTLMAAILGMVSRRRQP